MAAPKGFLLFAWAAAVFGPFVIGWLAWRLLRRGRHRLVWALVSLSVVTWGLGVWAFLIEPTSLTVRHVTIESATWQGPPLRIGLISDTHVASPHTDVARVRAVVARMNEEHPDIVMLLGDYAGGHEPAGVRDRAEQSDVLDGVRAFGALRSPLGAYGVLGNHDSWFDELALAAAMREVGIEVLENRAVPVPRGGGPFWVGGVADLHSKRIASSVPATLAEVPADADVLLLTHWPDPFETVSDRVDLTVAGHTHCGQVNLPLIGRPILPSPGSERWPCGLYDEGGRKLFVTGGVGVSILPVRFRAPPEIVIVTLRAPTLASGAARH